MYLPQYKKIIYTFEGGEKFPLYIDIDQIIDDCEEELPILLSDLLYNPDNKCDNLYHYQELKRIHYTQKNFDVDCDSSSSKIPPFEMSRYLNAFLPLRISYSLYL
jgi:hypothetical protein